MIAYIYGLGISFGGKLNAFPSGENIDDMAAANILDMASATIGDMGT